MIKRAIVSVIGKRLTDYPAVALDGPRQSGKTTLAKSLGGAYFDLEQESDRTRLDIQWDEVVNGSRLVVLDEAQEWPEIFPRLRGAIDRNRTRKGRFLLLGSVSPALKTRVAESLAGRVALVELAPFSMDEVPRVRMQELWLRGGFPEGGGTAPRRFPQWQHDHLTLVTQRDLPNWGMPAKPRVTTRLLRMIAAVHGQLWNASQIGKALGLSHPTVNTYLDYLEGAFLVRRLQPYFANLKKRLVKSPKIYWRDTGLLHALLRTSNYDQLLSQPWVGASWEGFVIEQTLCVLSHIDRRADPYFFRTSDAHEVDLVLDMGSEKWAIEIKLTSQPTRDDLSRLNKIGDLIGADRRILVTQTRETTIGRRDASCDLPAFLGLLRK